MITADEVQNVIDSVRSREEDIEIDTRSFLKKCGWRYTCDIPGSLWLYEKTLPDGRVALVAQSTALRIEASISR